MRYYNLSMLANSNIRACFMAYIRSRGYIIPKSNIKLKPAGVWYRLDELIKLKDSYKKANKKIRFAFADTNHSIFAKRLDEFIDSIERGEDLGKYAIEINPMFLIKDTQ
ncbi:hypothetical protein [Helicobacter sp. WB40]|uniref:hypothetical protein n=1 Tax=Helicobacter sp. WB40 TaxID=3004130 RepID=UPI0022EBD298|nr:hypothetical protein [Helicobacter sp. WB40]MDA3966649.1 hypothetical protein [Helicobacter sp. WB40]